MNQHFDTASLRPLNTRPANTWNTLLTKFEEIVVGPRHATFSERIIIAHAMTGTPFDFYNLGLCGSMIEDDDVSPDAKQQ